MATTRVIVETRVPRGLSREALYALAAHEIKVPGFTLDTDYPPVPVPPQPDIAAELATANEEVVVIRGMVDEAEQAALEREPRVVAVWSEARAEAFDSPSASPVSPTDLIMGR